MMETYNKQHAIAEKLSRHFALCQAPVKRLMALQGKEPFRILICAVLSARTRDQITIPTATALLQVAPDAAALRALSPRELENIIRPCGCYRTKASKLSALAQRLGMCFNDRIPQRLADLLDLPGVGRKTANLVLSLGYGRKAISVDIHVHRISNRLGLTATRTPEQTEAALQKVISRRYWHLWNPWLVALGQTICMPRNPRCEHCPIRRLCDKRTA